MNYDAAVEAINRYKSIDNDQYWIPRSRKDYCMITVRDYEVPSGEYTILIINNADCYDVSLENSCDLLCKRNSDNAIVARLDYAGEPHRDKGTYHIHIGREEHGGKTYSMEEAAGGKIDGLDTLDLVIPNKAMSLNVAWNHGRVEDISSLPDEQQVANAILGFLRFLSCDENDIDNLELTS